MFKLVDAKYSQQQQFAADIGVHPTRVSEWRKRKSASYVKRLEIISKVLDTTPQYLLSGEIPDIKASSPVSKPGTTSPADQRLVDAYHRAPENLQTAVRLVLGID